MAQQNFQPPWTQTGKTGGEDAKACTYYPDRRGPSRMAGQRLIGITEEGVEASVPHLPYRNMLDPSGNVCPVVVSTNRDLAEFNDKYEKTTLGWRKKKGWVLWDWDPNANDRAQILAGTEAAWLVKREELRAERQVRAKTQSARYDEMTKDRVQAVVDAAQATAQAQGVAIESLMGTVKKLLEQGDIRAAERVAGVKKKGDASAE